MNSSDKFAIIHTTLQLDDNMLEVGMLCALAGVSRSGYYRWVKAAPVRAEREEQDKRDFTLIMKAYNHRGYAKGARGIYMHMLHWKPVVVMNIKKIRRLMGKYGLQCPIRKANPYRRMAKALKTNHVADNVLERKFLEHGPRTVLLTDITYIPVKDGSFCYLSTILDAYTRQVLAYKTNDSLAVDFVLETVKILIEKHKIELTADVFIHSDQGSHYTSIKFIELLKNKGLRQSMSRRGNCWDNAPQESFFGHMKDEIDVKQCDYKEAKAKIDDWIDYYNNERYQWQLCKLSPNEYYKYITTGIHPLKR